MRGPAPAGPRRSSGAIPATASIRAIAQDTAKP